MNPTAQRRTELERYLALLARGAPAGTLLDIRWRRRGREAMSQDFRPALAPGTVSLLLRLSAHGDVYVGVAPRKRRAGGRDALAPCRLLWADCDSADAAAALVALPAPTMLVASGSGPNRHAYWSVGAALDGPQVEEGNRRLAAALGADTGAVCNPATILRPAGTLNHKRGASAPVRLLALDAGRCYPLAALLASLPALGEPLPRGSGGARRPGRDPLLELSPREYVRLLTGETVPRHGKVHCPLHEDDTPSLHAWADPARGWFCFGCNRGGTIYDLAAGMWGMSARGRDFAALRARLRRLCGIEEEQEEVA